jgi:hypothetical protein
MPGGDSSAPMAFRPESLDGGLYRLLDGVLHRIAASDHSGGAP